MPYYVQEIPDRKNICTGRVNVSCCDHAPIVNSRLYPEIPSLVESGIYSRELSPRFQAVYGL